MSNTDVDLKTKALKIAFNRFDNDGLGSITPIKLKSVFKDLNIRINDREVRMIFRVMDLNGDGEIQWDEFLEVMSKEYYRQHAHDKLKELFQNIDRNGDNLIDVNELALVFENLGKKETNEEIVKMTQAADLDGNGLISFDEFERLLNS